ncbi:MAG: lysostaphin resistance A-like protein [Bacillota bacterium]
MAGVLLFGFSGVALFEEGLFRGYLLQLLARRHPLHVSVAGTSLLFGLLHFASYPWNRVVWLGILNASALGAILSGSVLKSHSLMLALGYHLCWNVVQALLWDSRRLGGRPWVRLEVQGGLLAGDPASPETGLATTLALLLTLAYLLVRFGTGSTSRRTNDPSRGRKETTPSLSE